MFDRRRAALFVMFSECVVASYYTCSIPAIASCFSCPDSVVCGRCTRSSRCCSPRVNSMRLKTWMLTPCNATLCRGAQQSDGVVSKLQVCKRGNTCRIVTLRILAVPVVSYLTYCRRRSLLSTVPVAYLQAPQQ